MLTFNSKKEAESYLRCIFQIKLRDQIIIHTNNSSHTSIKTGHLATVQVAAIHPDIVHIEGHYPRQGSHSYVSLRSPRVFLTSSSSVLTYNFDDFDLPYREAIYQSMRAMKFSADQIKARYFKTLDNVVRVACIIKAK